MTSITFTSIDSEIANVLGTENATEGDLKLGVSPRSFIQGGWKREDRRTKPFWGKWWS